MGPQKLVHTPDVRNPEKYPDCRTDLIGGGGATQTFAPCGKHPRTATVSVPICLNLFVRIFAARDFSCCGVTYNL